MYHRGMKILDKLLGRHNHDVSDAGILTTVTETNPSFVAWNRGMYQQLLVRACIERIATACAKLKPEINGTARPRVRRAIETSPNQYMTWPQFLARCATIYFNDTTLFIVPEYVKNSDVICGYWPLKPASVRLVEYGNEVWVKYQTANAQYTALPYSEVAVITRFQYLSDFFGGGNTLDDTLDLLDAQKQAQKNALEDSAQVKFIGALNGQVREEDMKKKRDRFADMNLSGDNKTPLMIYDGTFVDIKQLDPKNWTIPPEEMARIENNVFDYFGLTRGILQNQYGENEWDAFYEGVIEPFGLQMGEAMSQMTFTMRERPQNRIMFSSNRLEYSSAASKRNMNKDMLDRGVMTINQALEVLQLPQVEGGDVRILRGEYKVGHTLDEIFEAQKAQAQAASGGRVLSEGLDIDGADADLSRGDSEGYGNAGDTDSGDVTSAKQDRWDS